MPIIGTQDEKTGFVPEESTEEGGTVKWQHSPRGHGIMRNSREQHLAERVGERKALRETARSGMSDLVSKGS